jgi:DNA-binding transcriptional LysR family regulator
MDWRSVGFDWNRARAFLVTAEEGSFSAAARALGAAQPTLGRQVGALERELGVTLFERVGTSLELTTAGLELVDHIRAMADAATRVSLTATGKSSSVVGTVCITASEVIAARLLPPVVHRLRIDHPGIELEIVASNEARDLHRREADIAVRNFRPTQANLVAKKLRDSRAHMYAAPSYLKRLGRVKSVKDLETAGAEIIAFDRTDVMIRGLRNMGFEATASSFPIVTANHLVQWELCKAGAGICFMMEEVGDAEPNVKRVLPKMPPLPVPIWLVCHRELQTSRRIRLVFDRIAEALTSPPER